MEKIAKKTNEKEKRRLGKIVKKENSSLWKRKKSSLEKIEKRGKSSCKSLGGRVTKKSKLEMIWG